MHLGLCVDLFGFILFAGLKKKKKMCCWLFVNAVLTESRFFNFCQKVKIVFLAGRLAANTWSWQP